jgi:glycosyltransferase involved in cell wall biosynthesis
MWNSALASVVISCYNQGHFLAEAIESVLGQTYRCYEIVVVDDGSTDATARVAAAYDHVRFLRQPNRGLAAARNAGLKTSAGQYVLFLDADDRLLPDALQVGIQSLKTSPESALSYGHVIPISVDGRRLKVPPQFAVNENQYLELLRHNYIWTTGAVVYRRSVLDELGGFNVTISGSADFDLNLRVARLFRICCSDTPVLEYRRHDQSMSRRYALMLKSAITARNGHRKFVKGNAALEGALLEGIRAVQADYGEKLISEIARHIRNGAWTQAAGSLLVALRYYPEGFAKHAGQKLSRSIPNLQG